MYHYHYVNSYMPVADSGTSEQGGGRRILGVWELYASSAVNVNGDGGGHRHCIRICLRIKKIDLM